MTQPPNEQRPGDAEQPDIRPAAPRHQPEMPKLPDLSPAAQSRRQAAGAQPPARDPRQDQTQAQPQAPLRDQLAQRAQSAQPPHSPLSNQPRQHQQSSPRASHVEQAQSAQQPQASRHSQSAQQPQASRQGYGPQQQPEQPQPFGRPTPPQGPATNAPSGAHASSGQASYGRPAPAHTQPHTQPGTFATTGLSQPPEAERPDASSKKKEKTGRGARAAAIILALLLPIGIVAGAAAGYIYADQFGAYDTLAVEREVTDVLREDYGLADLRNVDCPEWVKVEQGQTFQCEFEYAGASQTVTVTQGSQSGQLVVGAPAE